MIQSNGSETGRPEKRAQVDTLTDRLILDIKALMILGQTKGEEITSLVEDRIISSQDSQVAGFVRMIQETGRKPAKVKGLVFIAIGEMILASLMAILGIAILAPSVGGLSSPVQLFNYFSEIFQSAAVSQSSLSPVVPAIDLVFSLLLLLGAFYTLRMATTTLKESRLEGSQ